MSRIYVAILALILAIIVLGVANLVGGGNLTAVLLPLALAVVVLLRVVLVRGD